MRTKKWSLRAIALKKKTLACLMYIASIKVIIMYAEVIHVRCRQLLEPSYSVCEVAYKRT